MELLSIYMAEHMCTNCNPDKHNHCDDDDVICGLQNFWLHVCVMVNQGMVNQRNSKEHHNTT